MVISERMAKSPPVGKDGTGMGSVADEIPVVCWCWAAFSEVDMLIE